MYKKAAKLGHLGTPINLVGPVRQRKRGGQYSNFAKKGEIMIEVDTSRSQLRKRNKQLHRQRLGLKAG